MDNIEVTPGTGVSISADDIGGVLYQRVKIAIGADGSATDLSSSAPMPISDNSGSITVDGAFLTDTELRAADVAITLDGEEVTINDGGNTITVDGTVTVQDGGNTITVDGTVTANPSRVTLSTVTGTAATSGDNSIISAPGAGNRIRVYEFQLQLEADTATTVIVKSGSTSIRRVYMKAASDGIIWQWQLGQELVCGTNEALQINLSGANTVGYVVRYVTESAS